MPVRATAMKASSSLTLEAVRFDSPVVERLLSSWNDELHDRIPGFLAWRVSTVKPSDFAMPDGAFLAASRRTDAIGCGGLRRLSDEVGEIKRLFVAPAARGQGVGHALLRALEDQAKSLGYRTLRLDTDGGAPAALALFRSLGYRPIDDYNGNPYARYWFEKRLT